MKKLLSCLLLLALLCVGAAQAAIVLPADLTVIESGAFQGDISLQGVLTLPSGVTQVGDDAFSGTGLFGLVIPSGIASVGQQTLGEAGYVRVQGASTVLEGLSGVEYIIGPSGSAAQTYAASAGIDFVPESQLVADGGFYYQDTGDGLILLSAVNADSVGSTVVIPTQVNGQPVTAVSDYAFMGCTSLTEIHLPAAVEGSVPASALADCADAQVAYHSGAVLAVTGITADAATGVMGGSITWSVETASTHDVVSYVYTLSFNGEVISTEESQSAAFTCTAEQAGAYQLTVEIRDAEGNTARSVSEVLYIAEEAMVMTVPETLTAGEDLVIEVIEVAGATRYMVEVTDEATGQSVSYRTLTAAGKITVYGCMLEPGEYRVSGYVAGSDFRYTVPTVKMVTVSGDKAAGPAIPAQEPIVRNYEGLELTLSETEQYAVRYWFCYSDGTLSQKSTSVLTAGSSFYVYPSGTDAQWESGGMLYLQGAIKADGLWSAWGDVTEVTVQSLPKLDAAVLNAPATAAAGTDYVFTFEAVENATQYNVFLLEGYSENADGPIGDEVWGNGYAAPCTITIPGYEMNEGTYTVGVYAWGSDYVESYTQQRLDVTGTRPAAPTLTADKTEMYQDGDTLTLSISAPGSEGAYVRCTRMVNGESHGGDTSSTSLDENGYGTYCYTDWFGDNSYDNCTLRCQVWVIIDGVWSQPGVLEIPMLIRDPMPGAVITAPETLTAGQDLSFSFAAVENADYYYARLYRSYDTSDMYTWYKSEALPDTTLTLPGHYLTQGNYYLKVEASSESYGSSTSEVLFTVTGSRPTPPEITADLEEVCINDTLTFTFDTTGAEKIRIVYQSTQNSSGSFYSGNLDRTPAGDSTTWSYTFPETAVDLTYTFRFSVKKDGVWSAWKTFERTVGNLPAIQAPVINCQPTYQAGEDITITIDPVEGADSYSCTWYYEDDWRGGYSGVTEPRNIVLNGYGDWETGVYTVQVTASGAGYSSTTATAAFEIIGERTAAPAVTVDTTAVAVQEKFTFTIDTTGVELLRYRYTIDGSSGSSSGEITVLENETKWTTSSYNEQTQNYSFIAFKDGRWTAWSEPIDVVITAVAALDEPVVTLPASISEGEDLTVSVAQVTDATSYRVYLYNSRGAQVTSQYISSAEGGSVTFSGYRLSQGSYTVTTYAYGTAGSSSTSSTVTVNAGERPDAPAVTPETDLGRIGVYYTFDVASTGAQQVAVRYYQDGYTGNVTYRNMDASGDVTTWKDSKSTAGQVWNYAFAVQVEGVWSDWSASCKVTISNREQLAEVTLNVPDTLAAGQDLYVSFTAVENADSYTLYLYKPDGSSSSYTAYPDQERRFVGYNIDPGDYRVEVKASGAEYDDSVAKKTFTVTGTRAEAPAVSVDTQSVYTDDTYVFMIDTTGGEEVVYRYAWESGGYNYGLLNVLSDVTAWETSAWSDGVIAYSFSLYKDGAWSAWSDAIRITVNARPVLPDPVVSVPATLDQGCDLTVTVDAVEGASYYYVYAYNNRNQQIAYRYLNAAGDAVIPGYLLPVGTVRIEVYAYGSNNGSSSASTMLEILSAAQPDAPAVTPPEQTTVAASTYFAFTVGTDGAENVVVRYYRIGAPNDVSYTRFDPSGEAETTWSTSRYNSGYTYAYSFAVQIDGVWSQWSSFTEITVE